MRFLLLLGLGCGRHVGLEWGEGGEEEGVERGVERVTVAYTDTGRGGGQSKDGGACSGKREFRVLKIQFC